LFRNKAAYIVGRIINGQRELPFAVPILQNERGELYLDALLVGESQLLVLFSFARAYFFVDMEVPAACVSFLRWLMPKKPRAEIYMAVGLAKQGKTLFYRDLHYHLRHSSDRYGVAIKELAGAGIFPGDMLLKNFGVTRHERIVFYDYDEIAPMTDVIFRRIPPPRDYEDEIAAEPYWSMGPGDVFPEQFERFLV